MLDYKDSVVVLSGRLEVNGQQNIEELLDYDYNPFENETDRNKVDIVVYKTSSTHFAVVYPSFELVRHICSINLKTSIVTLLTEDDKYELHIKSKNDFDNNELVLKIEAENKNLLHLWAKALKSEDEDIISPFGSRDMFRKRSVSRETSLEKVNEEEEFL